MPWPYTHPHGRAAHKRHPPPTPSGLGGIRLARVALPESLRRPCGRNRGTRPSTTWAETKILLQCQRFIALDRGGIAFRILLELRGTQIVSAQVVLATW